MTKKDASKPDQTKRPAFVDELLGGGDHKSYQELMKAWREAPIEFEPTSNDHLKKVTVNCFEDAVDAIFKHIPAERASMTVSKECLKKFDELAEKANASPVKTGRNQEFTIKDMAEKATAVENEELNEDLAFTTACVLINHFLAGNLPSSQALRSAKRSALLHLRFTEEWSNQLYQLENHPDPTFNRTLELLTNFDTTEDNFTL